MASKHFSKTKSTLSSSVAETLNNLANLNFAIFERSRLNKITNTWSFIEVYTGNKFEKCAGAGVGVDGGGASFHFSTVLLTLREMRPLFGRNT